MTEGADPAEFRAAMGRWPTGVSVVTTRHAGVDAGLTVNAFLSVSLRPPITLVSLTHDADTTPLVEFSRRFAISVLAADQREISQRFAAAIPMEQKFAGVEIDRGLADVPLIRGAVVQIECRLRSFHPVTDHHLLIGEVERVGRVRDAPPLIFYRSQYAVLEPDGRLRLGGGP